MQCLPDCDGEFIESTFTFTTKFNIYSKYVNLIYKNKHVNKYMNKHIYYINMFYNEYNICNI